MAIPVSIPPGVEISPSASVTVLGVTIDSSLSMDTQVGKAVRAAFLHIRQLMCVSHCLPTDAIKSLVDAFVIARLDYSNVVYVGLPAFQLNRLQLAFNAAARVIYRERKSCHITPLLESLH